MSRYQRDKLRQLKSYLGLIAALLLAAITGWSLRGYAYTAYGDEATFLSILVSMTNKYQNVITAFGSIATAIYSVLKLRHLFIDRRSDRSR